MLGPKHIGVTTLTFQGHVTSRIMWPFDSHRRSIVAKCLSPAIFEIMGTKHIWVTILTFHGHVTLSVTWPFDFQVAISYRCSIVIKSVYAVVSEILGPKHIGVTTVTSQYHVTSSVTWPFSFSVAISYSCSIVTKCLSAAIFEIICTKHIGVTTFSSRVTWRHRSRDHWTRDGLFPIGGPLFPSLSVTVSGILCPKPHVLIDSILNRHCACAISRDVCPM